MRRQTYRDHCRGLFGFRQHAVAGVDGAGRIPQGFVLAGTPSLIVAAKVVLGIPPTVKKGFL